MHVSNSTRKKLIRNLLDLEKYAAFLCESCCNLPESKILIKFSLEQITNLLFEDYSFINVNIKSKPMVVLNCICEAFRATARKTRNGNHQLIELNVCGCAIHNEFAALQLLLLMDCIHKFHSIPFNQTFVGILAFLVKKRNRIIHNELCELSVFMS